MGAALLCVSHPRFSFIGARGTRTAQTLPGRLQNGAQGRLDNKAMDIRELLSSAGIEYVEEGQHHHSRPHWLQIHCPFCGSQNFHLGIHLSGRWAACWRCGGKSIYAVWKKLGLDARRLTWDSLAPVQRAEPQGLKEPAGRGALLKLHKLYLARRGFDWRQLQALWRLEGIGLAARLRWRIYIPIEFRGKRVSWTTRAVGERVEQRYISASPAEEAVSHKQILYGWDYCLHSCVVVEGPTDVWAVGPGAVALFGTAFTAAQVRLLSGVPNRFVCLDNSAAAQAHARELAAQLSAFPGNTMLVQLDAADPGSAPKKELERLRRAAKL